MSSPATMTWPDVVRVLDERNGIHLVTMETLRRIEGAQRVGPGVINTIHERLDRLGVGHLPTDLPSRADDAVLLYRRGTPASEVIRAIQEGLKGSVVPASVEALRRMNESPAEEVVSARDVAKRATEALDALTDLLSMADVPNARGRGSPKW